MVCCCASCDNSSGAVESPQPQPLGSLRALRTGPGGGVRAPLGPSHFLTTTEALEPRVAFAAIGDHCDRATADDGGFVYNLAFHLLLGRVYDDKDVQERIVRRSKLDWVIVRPVILTDGPKTNAYRALVDPRDWTCGFISRADVADFLVKQIDDDAFLYKTPVLMSSLPTSRSEPTRPPYRQAA